jgi:hypothetical protein
MSHIITNAMTANFFQRTDPNAAAASQFYCLTAGPLLPWL